MGLRWPDAVWGATCVRVLCGCPAWTDISHMLSILGWTVAAIELSASACPAPPVQCLCWGQQLFSEFSEIGCTMRSLAARRPGPWVPHIQAELETAHFFQKQSD